jgi:hypothetical protein
MAYKLQSLRIPSGWKVSWNTFTEFDPLEITGADDENWWLFDEDLLQLECSHKNLILDLGWYGGKNLITGNYGLYLIQNQDWENPLLKFLSKNKDEIVSKIESVLTNINRS